MKKFTFKGVLDGFRSSVAQQVKPDQEIIENLRSEHFQVKKTFRHGFPYQPTAMAFDPVQKLLAIGTKSGSLRILGRPGVDAHVKHEEGDPITQLLFLINEGALVSATEDTLHLWNFRQKIPQVVQSLKFQRERITCMHLPLQSKWLYLGTEKGNIHVVHIETFVLSGYVINWNKAIDVSRKTHPGAVIHLSDNPLDLSKMLIGYDSGQIVFWDLKLKQAEYRCHTDQPLKSISWHHEGKQFMCSHTDGSLSTWAVRQAKPSNVTHPHAKNTKDGEPEPCKPIQKVEWKLSRSGEAYVIFSGGLACDIARRTPSITVIQGKTTTVLEMEHNVVDFITLCESPWSSDFQDPYAVVVLLQNDLVVIDLLTPGFPCFENPYPMDLHESPVTCCAYFADCPSELVPAFYSVGSKSQKKSGFSEKDWPISGGEWSSNSSSYSEIILTGHADGSIKFWDASAGTLQVLYKLKTAKLFEKSRPRSVDNDEDPLSIQLIFLCPESRKLAIAGAGRHVVLFKFKKAESMSEVVTLEVSLTSDPSRDMERSPEVDSSATGNVAGAEDTRTTDKSHTMKVKTGLQKRAPGFQATLICLTYGVNGEQPESITALSLNSSYGLMAYGNETGLVIVDIVQKVTLLFLSTTDLGSSTDPYQRTLRSPKRQEDVRREAEDKARSPSIDQKQVHQIHEDNRAINSDAKGNDDSVNSGEEDVRKSHGWKSFKLKRQLSKVDMKIKSTLASFSMSSQDGGAIDLQRASPSIYSTTTPEAPRSLSPIDSGDREAETSRTTTDQDARTDETDGVTADNKSRDRTNAASATAESARPTNLALNEGESKSMKFKRIVRGIQAAKREARLLSVPNARYQKESATCDLRCEDASAGSAATESSTFAGNLMRRFNKVDSSFQRSRSSSMSSLENIATETISCLTFADSYTKKSDSSALPTLWIGTSLGSVQTIIFNTPSPSERHMQSVIISTCSGSTFKLKGCILSISFLDYNGALIPYSSESWKDENTDCKDRNKNQAKSASSRVSPSVNAQATSSDGFEDRQFVVLTSEKQARVVALPSQNCVHRAQLTDTNIVIKAEITSLKDSVCLLCYISNGHIATYSLPSLRPLVDVDFLPLTDLRIARTLCFSNKGHGLYLSSPTEIHKFTVSSEFCSELTDMMGDLFIGTDMPEPPKEGFFKGLFGGGSRSLDREELFGESSGRASKSVAKHIPGPNAATEATRDRVTGVTGEISRAHEMVVERGEKLSQLEERTARMMSEAENFSSSAHGLMLKYKDKKWYQI